MQEHRGLTHHHFNFEPHLSAQQPALRERGFYEG
jgi:hypothetical protein